MILYLFNSNINKSNGFFGGPKMCTLVCFGQFPAQPTVKNKDCWSRMARTSWTKKILLLLLTGNFDLQNGYYNMSLCRASSGFQIVCCVTCSYMG